MPAKSIVGFFDILGYENLVGKMINDVGFIKRFDDLMFGVTVDLLESLRSLDLAAHTDQPVDNAYFRKVVDTIKVRCIYDSVIFSLPLSDITFDSRQKNGVRGILPR